jgi:signal peptidase I
VSRKAGAEAYLDTLLSIWAERGERTRCPLTGSSMAPLLQDGDVLVVEHGNGHLRLGDVIVFRVAGRIKAHRLLRRRRAADGGLLYLTKGDASVAFDAPVPAEQVIGKVVEVYGASRHQRLDSPFRVVVNYLVATESAARAVVTRVWGLPRSLVRRAKALHHDLSRRGAR